MLETEVVDLRKPGTDPNIAYGLSNGVEAVMSRIAARARPGSVALLRFHGHGENGMQTVPGGALKDAADLSAISIDNLPLIAGSPMRITPIFAPCGCVQLMGCSVGGGKGKALVQRLADIWRAPVSAGVFVHYASGVETFTIEGPTVTGFPGGGDLKSWSQRQEAMHGAPAAAGGLPLAA